MSHKVVTLVYSVKAGSAVRKAVLAYMADCASDDGSGVWASKKTIADELECGRSTVIRACNEFVSEGLIRVTGSRKCANGATVEYALNLDAIKRLPRIEKKAKTSQSGTSSDRDPSQSGTPPVPERDPKTSQSGTQTVLEPSLNQDTNVSLSPKVISQHFEDFWNSYPHRNGKKTKKDEAKVLFRRAIKSGVSFQEIADGVKAMERDTDVLRGYGRGPVPWLRQRGWTDEIPEAPPQFSAINGGQNEPSRTDPQLDAIALAARMRRSPGADRH